MMPVTDVQSVMKTWKCPNGHGGKTAIAKPTCPVCGEPMVKVTDNE